MLNVSYKNRIGYCTLTQESIEGKHKWKIWFCHANCLCAMMYFYDKTEEDGKKTPMVQLHMFFNDVKHAENCIKDNIFRDYSNFHFYAKEMDDRMWKLVKIMTKHGIKVTIE